MPTIIQGRRTHAGRIHVIGYEGKDGLLTMLDEVQTQYLNVLEEAARRGWLEPDALPELEDQVAAIAAKYGVPQGV